MDATGRDGKTRPTEEGVAFPLATSRYGAGELVNESGLIPVRISVGAPRFALAFPLAESCPLLFPRREMLKLGYHEYRRRFRHNLHKTGVRRIREQLEAISQRHGGKGIVLLCFEDVAKPGEWCHRTLFAEWWEQQTGIAVPELTADVSARPALFR